MSGHNVELADEKIAVLKEYVTKGEELLSNIESWESLAGIIEERDILIAKLESIELRLKKSNSEPMYTAEQKTKINELIKLILDMDQDSMKLINEEKNKTVEDLKTNQKQQKIVSYETPVNPSYGKFLDVKK